MNLKHNPESLNMGPVAIGGLGGSGTRLIARSLIEQGFFMGADQNKAHDNLWFTLLFKRLEILTASGRHFAATLDIFLEAMAGEQNFSEEQKAFVYRLAQNGRKQHPAHWLQQRAKSILATDSPNGRGQRWGWKEPNTHILLPWLNKTISGLKYIHVARNGLDMAHSSNQNQLELWGKNIIGEHVENTPHDSLKYWCLTHKRIMEIGEEMGSNFLFLNYDHFCSYPHQGINKLCAFLEIDENEIRRHQLRQLIHPPESIGRFKQFDLSQFDPEDVAYVKHLGFDTTDPD